MHVFGKRHRKCLLFEQFPFFCRNHPQAGYMNGTIGKVSKLDENDVL
jgi:hypothetical protein